jgi:sarcosine oxidase subunit alpha
MPPGFYYKTFMYPKKLWMTYEHFIRKAAGLGATPVEADPDSYDRLNQHCDVLVVGAGPAGLVAAREAARTGARVIIADEQSEFGGSLLASKQSIDGLIAAEWVASLVAELRAYNNVQLLPRSTVFGYYDHNFLTILERRTDHLGLTSAHEVRQRMHKVRAARVVLATGAFERPLVFAHNDIPGVMLASSVSTYVNRYGVAPGNKLVLFTTNDNAYQTALDWHQTGREVVAVIDSRSNPRGDIVAAVKAQGILEQASGSVAFSTAQKRLGMTRSQMETFIRSGILKLGEGGDQARPRFTFQKLV